MTIFWFICSVIFAVLGAYSDDGKLKRYKPIIWGATVCLFVIFTISVKDAINRKETPKELDLSIFEEENIARVNLAAENATDVIFCVNKIDIVFGDGTYKVCGKTEDESIYFIAPMSLEDAAKISIGDMIRVRGDISVDKLSNGTYYVRIGSYTDSIFTSYHYAKLIEIS